MSKNSTLTFSDHDHTLGNLLRSELLRDPDVIFAAYKVPHPLTRSVEVRVQTFDNSVEDDVNSAIKNIISSLEDFEEAFEKALSE